MLSGTMLILWKLRANFHIKSSKSEELLSSSINIDLKFKDLKIHAL